MEQKISKTDELHLTRAIEKAAALAAVNDEYDRDKLLVDQLKHEKVDKRFAKTAAAAFNKRMTVLLLQKTADEHKADTYELAHPDHVFELMGGELPQDKSASVKTDFFAELRPVMQKVASKTDGHKRAPYEATVRLDTYMEHLEGIIDKQAAEFNELNDIYESLDSRVVDRTADVVADLKKLGSASFEMTTLGKLYGSELSDIIGAYMDCGKLEKNASVVKPEGGIYDKVASLMQDIQSRENLKDYICFYKEGLSEFLKTANVMADVVEWARYHGADMTKMAADDWSEQTQLSLQNAVNNRARNAAIYSGITTGLGTGIALANEGVNALSDTVHTLNNGLSAGFGNAFRLYNASRDPDMSANKVLDSEFITNDRYRDRLMAWSDMTADPMFSMYPANQVFAATQKALNTNLSLERPDNREVLRATVGQLLAQNNRSSTADIAALATTLKQLAAAQPSGAVSAALAAKEVGKVERRQPVELAPTMQPIVNSSKTDITEAMSRAVENAQDRKQKLKDQAFDYQLKGIEAEGKRREGAIEAALKTLQANHPDHRVVVRNGRPVLLDDDNNITALPEAELRTAIQDAAATQRTFGTAGLTALKDDLANMTQRDTTEREIALRILQADNPGESIVAHNGQLMRRDRDGNYTAIGQAEADAAMADARSMRQQFGEAAGSLAKENLDSVREGRKSSRDDAKAANELAMQSMLRDNRGISASVNAAGDYEIVRADGTTAVVRSADFDRYLQPAARAVSLVGADGARRLSNEVERLSDKEVQRREHAEDMQRRDTLWRQQQDDRTHNQQRQRTLEARQDTEYTQRQNDRDTQRRLEDAVRPVKEVTGQLTTAIKQLMGESVHDYANRNRVTSPTIPRIITTTDPNNGRQIEFSVGDSARGQHAAAPTRTLITEQNALNRLNSIRSNLNLPPVDAQSAEFAAAWNNLVNELGGNGGKRK